MPSEESLIKDLKEIEQEFRNNDEHRKANTIELFIIQSTNCKIPREKIVNLYNKLKDKVHVVNPNDDAEVVNSFKLLGAIEVLEKILRNED